MLLGVLTFSGEPARSCCTRWCSAASRSSRSIIGTFAVRRRRQRRARALPGPDRRRHRSPRCCSYPITDVDDGRPRPPRGEARAQLGRHLLLRADRPRASPRALFVITDYYTSTRFAPVQVDGQASETGHATNIIQGLAQGLQATAAPGARDRARHLRRVRARRHLRHRRRRDGAALADRPDRRARRVRPDHRQRRRHRRDGGHARRGPQRHRPAGRGRQHDQGRHQGLRDRLRRARRAGAVRGVQDRAASEESAAPIEFAARRPARAHRPADRRHDGQPVRRALDGGRRPRRRRRRRGGAPPVPREAGDHGRHRAARVRPVRGHRDQRRPARDDHPVADPDRRHVIVGMLSVRCSAAC